VNPKARSPDLALLLVERRRHLPDFFCLKPKLASQRFRIDEDTQNDVTQEVLLGYLRSLTAEEKAGQRLFSRASRLFETLDTDGDRDNQLLAQEVSNGIKELGISSKI
jgi:hypothetical protein